MCRTTIHDKEVYGVSLDSNTGCSHHRTSLDIIAVKFKCCQTYYACYSCHLELSDHPHQRWNCDDVHTKAILCGRCGMELTIHEYLFSNHQCVNCKSGFNPGCKKHWDLYFNAGSGL